MDGGRASGRPAKGLFLAWSEETKLDSVLRWVSFCDGMICLSLLCGGGDLKSCDSRDSSALASERGARANFEGGGGREPDGREGWH